MTFAPFLIRNSRERNPQETEIQSTPEFLAVIISTSESPTYTHLSGVVHRSRIAAKTASDAGFFFMSGLSPYATSITVSKNIFLKEAFLFSLI